MLNNTNIIYVFNPILLTNVFTTDLPWSNSSILISKRWHIRVWFFVISELCWIFLSCVIFFMSFVRAASFTVHTWIYIYAFSRRFYPKRHTVHSGYTFFVSMCVSWELNPQPFALLTQCFNHWATGTLRI